jgi:hypothetical protein
MKHATSLYTTLVQPFRAGTRLDLRLLAAFVLINGLVFANAYLHDPAIGYDSPSYFGYIRALSNLRLVTPQDSRESFSPPLPFAFPALLMAFTGVNLVRAAKLAQFLNVLLSVGLTWYLLKTAALLESRASLRLGALVFLGILPVYYKSFAFVRGEPFVACFTVVILYYLTLMVLRKQFTLTNATILGLLMGLSALSRQWAILLFPSIFLLLGYHWIRLRPWRASILKVIGLSFVIAAAVGGWFYLYLQSSQGSFTAFNRPAADGFSFDNQPPEFYTGLGSKLLFQAPVRPNFPNQFAPILYSEIWGDYWGYFSVSATDTRTSTHLNGRDLTDLLATGSRPSWLETNYYAIRGYLGRVNLVSLLPSALALISIGLAAAAALSRQNSLAWLPGQRSMYSFLLLAICTTMLGYYWFLIMFPRLDKGGDTIKATYLLHLFPFVAVMVGSALKHVEEKSQLLYRVLIGMLCVVGLHNAAAMVSHY